MVERLITRSPEEQIAELTTIVSFLEERLMSIEERLWCPECQLPKGAMLSDKDIQRLVRQGRIRLEPLPNIELGEKSDLGPCKIDLHLGGDAIILDASQVANIDLNSGELPKGSHTSINIKRRGQVIIHPRKVVIASALECLTLPDDIAARMEGKSKFARRGIAVQIAPVFDPGWDGKPALELHNIGEVAVVLPYGVPVCAMTFYHLSSPTLKGYARREGVRYAVQDKARF